MREAVTTVAGVPVDPALARKLSRAARRVQEATEARDQLVAEAVASGGSYREVAELIGLSHTSVANIVRRGTTDDQ